jgi:hypothetical protein
MPRSPVIYLHSVDVIPWIYFSAIEWTLIVESDKLNWGTTKVRSKMGLRVASMTGWYFRITISVEIISSSINTSGVPASFIPNTSEIDEHSYNEHEVKLLYTFVGPSGRSWPFPLLHELFWGVTKQNELIRYYCYSLVASKKRLHAQEKKGDGSRTQAPRATLRFALRHLLFIRGHAKFWADRWLPQRK